jgi:hypothetical protein
MSRLEVAPDLKLAPREPADLFEVLVQAAAQRAAEIVSEQAPRQRWATGIEGLADYLGISDRLARELRAKGCPARKLGKRLYFDLREVDLFLEREGVAA